MDSGCLVCRRTDRTFASREHPFPESLGNADLVLPAGVVCDDCNHGPLSVLDQALCDFLPVKMRRTMLGVRSRAGRVLTTKCVTGSIEHIGPSALRFWPSGSRDMLREVTRTGDAVHLKFDLAGGRKLTSRYGSSLSRALLKIGLEVAWLDHGMRMLGRPYDHVRDAILDRPRDGFVVIAKKGNPDSERLSLTYDFAADGAEMWIVADLFGVTLATASKLAKAPVELLARTSAIEFTTSDWRRAA